LRVWTLRLICIRFWEADIERGRREGISIISRARIERKEGEGNERGREDGQRFGF
jgi:hypothetical protein